MPRLLKRSQLPLYVKRAICSYHAAHPHLRQEDVARWCFTRYGIRPDRSTIGRVIRNEARWSSTSESSNTTRVRGGAHPDLERRMLRWIGNAGPAGIPLTLATIRHHAAGMARDMGIPASFRCSVGWVRRTMRRHGIRCMATREEAADQDLAAVMTCKTQLPALLMHLTVQPADVFNFDETALPRTVQRCWWRTGCLPNAWEMQLEHVGDAADADEEAVDELAEELGDVGALIRRLDLGSSAMPAEEFVAIDDDQPTCAEPGEDPLATEPPTEATADSWDPPVPFAGVYDDLDPVSREARRNARAACEMLIGYSRAVGIEPRDISNLFDIRNPIIVERLERASPRLDLNEPAEAPTPAPARRGRVLPMWMTRPSRRQELINGSITAVMGGYPESAEWFRI
ncbi:unnamed protein product [Closterium sp. Naga37s-1]|nr:unnamed protein product [Closterium sp. Naga37s-1]